MAEEAAQMKIEAARVAEKARRAEVLEETAPK
jgi:hypothetical protein